MHEEMIVIGILEESRKRATFILLKDLLRKSNYNIIYENIKGNIVILSRENESIMIMDMNPSNIEFIDDIGFDFHILIHTFLKAKDYSRQSLKEIFKRAKNIIVNCDENGWTYLLENNKESIVITYGFNNKATINPSSYNIQYSIKTNICFQREIVTILGDVIEPFEIHMKINSMVKQNLYSGMSVLACALILGINSLLVEELIEFKVENL